MFNLFKLMMQFMLVLGCNECSHVNETHNLKVTGFLFFYFSSRFLLTLSKFKCPNADGFVLLI